MAARAVEAVIGGEINSVEQLRPLAPQIVEWLKESLPLANVDDNIKRRIKLLLSTRRFTLNLGHFGLWDDLIRHCSAEAEKMGRDMQVCCLPWPFAATLHSCSRDN